ALGRRKPVLVASAALQRGEVLSDEEVAIRDGQRVFWQLAPELVGERDFSRRVISEARGGQQVRAQGHDGQQPYHRIGTAIARPVPLLATEGLPIVRRVWHPQRRAVDAVERQAAPPVLGRAHVSPAVRRGVEQVFERLLPQSLPRLRDGALGGGLSTCGRQRQ